MNYKKLATILGCVAIVGPGLIVTIQIAIRQLSVDWRVRIIWLSCDNLKSGQFVQLMR